MGLRETMRRTAIAVVLLGLLLVGCSKSPSAPDATNTGPSSGTCNAVKAVITAAGPGLESPLGTETVAQRAQDWAQYYQRIGQAIQASGATDSDSTSVLHDVEQLATAETAFAAVETGNPAGTDPKLINALGAVNTATDQLVSDSGAFDLDCGVSLTSP
jgi:hypothetical protein